VVSSRGYGTKYPFAWNRGASWYMYAVRIPFVFVIIRVVKLYSTIYKKIKTEQ
jgi:hypothetical protein